MPATQYFAAGGVSGSMLNVLYDECPAKLKAQMEATPFEESEALEFGTWFHRCVLEPETLEGAYHIKPEGMSFATKDGKAWRAAHQDRPIIEAKDIRAIQGMTRSLHANPDFMKLFRGGTSEQSLFATDDKGVLRKGRFDRLHTSGNFIIDLKSCESAKPAKFQKTIERYGYYRKAAWYIDLANLCGMKKEAFIFAAVEKEPPYLCQLYDLDQEDIALGADENERLLDIYRVCAKTGIWKGYGDGIQPIGLPEYRRSQLTQQLAS